METAFTVIGLAIAVLAALMGLLIYNLNKRDKKMERMIKGEIAEKKYMRAAGTLTYYTARAVHQKGLCNGEVAEAMKHYKSCEHNLEDFQQETNIMNNVKGG